MKVLAFDIGIKNLAYCILDASANICAWENVNLLVEREASDTTVAAQAPTSKCHFCKSKPSWTVATPAATLEQVCKRHIPSNRPALTDLSGNILKTIPVVSVLKNITAAIPLPAPRGGKKEDYVKLLATKYAIPIVASRSRGTKAKKATDTALEEIHDKIRLMVQNRAELLRDCTHVLLENQPAFKNPTMKSVQILLFATLRDFYYSINSAQIPSFHLIHAGKKVKGAAKGDAGYTERKDGGEARVKKWLAEPARSAATTEKWITLFNAAPKKSDLADALCMCIDYMK